MELKKLKNLVIEALKVEKEFRENDDELYLAICNIIFSEKSDRFLSNMTVGEFITNRKNYGLPSFESVSRCRRKAQEEFPDLRPCEKVQEARRKQEEKFYDFSKLKQQSFDF